MSVKMDEQFENSLSKDSLNEYNGITTNEHGSINMSP